MTQPTISCEDLETRHTTYLFECMRAGYCRDPERTRKLILEVQAHYAAWSPSAGSRLRSRSRHNDAL